VPLSALLTERQEACAVYDWNLKDIAALLEFKFHHLE
jgi:hypothetical protein